MKKCSLPEMVGKYIDNVHAMYDIRREFFI